MPTSHVRLIAPREPLTVRLLGSFALLTDGQELDTSTWPSRPLALLRLLAASGGRVTRDEVIDLFWPDSSPEAGRANLRGLAHRLRQLLGKNPPPVLIQGAWVTLNPVVVCNVDLVEFEAAVQEAGDDAAALSAALEAYRGEPLVEDRHEAWAAPIRERVRRVYREGVLRLCTSLRAMGSSADAIRWLERFRASDPVDETALRLYFHLLAESGRRSEIRRVYERFVRRLKAEHNLEPEEETQVVVDAVSQAETATPPSDRRQPVEGLPGEITPFIGRQREVHAIESLLGREGVRLVTLTGPGGIGKTRVAMHVAARVSAAFPDGVTFIDLSSLAEANLVGSTIASALHLPSSGAPPSQRLVAALRTSRKLLVIDNFEHVLDAVPVVSEIIASCRGVRVLATSREILHLRAEYEYPVPPLSVPPDAASQRHGPALGIERAQKYDAIQLFVERARTIYPSFALTAENVEIVAKVCRRLEGVPLAIEIAVARLRQFTFEALLATLEQRLQLGGSGLRDVPGRQRTLRAAIDWSHALLTPEEQSLLARLAIFAGGWTLEAAEAVCRVDGYVDMLMTLSSLLEKSLVRRDESGRFSMLETLREFAAEKLGERGEKDRLAEAHAEYYVALVGSRRMQPGERPTHHHRLEAELANLRQTLDWAQRRARPDLGLRMMEVLEDFWILRGLVREQYDRLNELLVAPGGIDRRLRALSRATAMGYGQMFQLEGWEEDARVVDETVAVARELRDPELLILALSLIAQRTSKGPGPDEEEALVAEIEQMSEERGYSIGIAIALQARSITAFRRNDFDVARDLEERSLALVLEAEEWHWATMSLSNLVMTAVQQGDATRAWQRVLECLDMCKTAGYSGAPVFMVEAAVGAAVAAGQIELGARLLGASVAERRRGGTNPPPDEKVIIDQATARGTAALGQEVWDRAVASGESLSLLDVADLLRNSVPAGIPSPHQSTTGSSRV